MDVPNNKTSLPDQPTFVPSDSVRIGGPFRLPLQILFWTLCVLLGLGLWGVYFAGFVPSRLGREIGLVSAFAGAALGAPAGYFTPGAAFPRNPWLRDEPSCRAIVFCLILGMVSYFAVGVGFPATYTAIFGRTADETVTVTGWRSGSSRVCEGPDLAEAPMIASVCLDESWKQKLPNGASLILTGKTSPMGMDATHVRLP